MAREDVGEMSEWQWTPKREQAVLLDAQGHTAAEIADKVGVTQRTIERWRSDIQYSAERDRLSLMVDIAGRAERLRIARRVVRDKTRGATPDTARDLLDWLKFAQSETDGVKLDLAALAEALGNTNDQ